MFAPPADRSGVDPRIVVRRERVFLALAGVFLGTLAILNILGISRFVVTDAASA